MTEAEPDNEPLAIICGGGSFPGAVAEAVRRRGRRPVMFGINGWADPAVIERYAHHWIALGQAGRFFRLARLGTLPARCCSSARYCDRH